MDKDIQKIIRQRAEHCCEYCRSPEAFAELPFHFDHIIAKQHGGQSTLGNLALACCYCNRYKGPNLSGIDPGSGRIVPLFHPRLQIWEEHFQWTSAKLNSSTPTGRATIQLLQVNRADAVAVRDLLMQEGVFLSRPGSVHEPALDPY